MFFLRYPTVLFVIKMVSTNMLCILKKKTKQFSFSYNTDLCHMFHVVCRYGVFLWFFSFNERTDEGSFDTLFQHWGPLDFRKEARVDGPDIYRQQFYGPQTTREMWTPLVYTKLLCILVLVKCKEFGANYSMRSRLYAWIYKRG